MKFLRGSSCMSEYTRGQMFSHLREALFFEEREGVHAIPWTKINKYRQFYIYGYFLYDWARLNYHLTCTPFNVVLLLTVGRGGEGDLPTKGTFKQLI